MAGDDSLLSLYLKVEGGEASAAEIDDLKGRLEALDTEVDASQSNLESQFSKKFEHIALQGFLRDGAKSVGLSGELRQGVSLLTTAFNSMGLAIEPEILGLVALGAILFEVYNHTKEHTSALKDETQANNDASAAVKTLNDKFNEYESIVGKLPKILADSKKAQNDFNNTVTDPKRIADAESAINEIYKKIAADRAQINSNNALSKSAKDYTETVGGYSVVMTAAHQQEEYARETAQLTLDLIKQKKALDDATQALNAHAQGVKDEGAVLDKGVKEVNDQAAAYDALSKRIKAATDKDFHEMERKEKKQAEIDAEAAKKHRAMLDGIIGGDKAGWDEIEQLGIKAMAGLENSTSSTLAKCLVEHKNFASATKYIWRNLAEEVIQGLIKMGEQAIVSAVLQKTQSEASAAAAIAANTAVTASVNTLTASYVALAVAEKSALI